MATAIAIVLRISFDFFANSVDNRMAIPYNSSIVSKYPPHSDNEMNTSNQLMVLTGNPTTKLRAADQASLPHVAFSEFVKFTTAKIDLSYRLANASTPTEKSKLEDLGAKQTLQAMCYPNAWVLTTRQEDNLGSTLTASWVGLGNSAQSEIPKSSHCLNA